MSKLDPTIEAELARIDAALETGRVTATEEADRELEALALALEADTPEPTREFTDRLGEQVREGFPRERRRRLPKLAVGRIPRQALAGVATLILMVAIAVPLIDSGSRGGGEDGAGATGMPAPPRSPNPNSTEQRPMAVPPADDDQALGRRSSGGGDFRPGQAERRIQRSAMLTLAAPDRKLDKVADDIVAITDRLDGFVLDSSVTSGENAVSGGRFELRVPASGLRTALSELSELGTVRARSQNGEDVTSSFVSASDRLQGAEAQRRGLLRRLENADNDTEAEALRRSLDVNAGEISRLRGELRTLRQTTDYATIEVTLERAERDGGAAAGPSDGLGGALDDALGTLSGALELAIRALGVIVPLGLLALLLGLAARTTVRRRREAALR